jgi:hypothetical protein
MKIKTMILAAMVLAAGLVGKAEAAVVVSSSSVNGVVAIAAPASGQVTKIKAMKLCNDTSTNLCVTLKDGTTFKSMLCAAAQACETYPKGVASPVYGSGIGGGVPAFLGENLTVSGAFNVTSSTPFALAAGGGELEISYIQQQ